jgi:hypothetical protein
MSGGTIGRVTDGAVPTCGAWSTIDRRRPRPSGVKEEAMSRHKLMAALAAVATALAVGLPASASAATTTVPTIPPITIPPITFGLGAGYVQSVVCPILVTQLHLAMATGNTLGVNVIGNVLLYSGCGGAAI